MFCGLTCPVFVYHTFIFLDGPEWSGHSLRVTHSMKITTDASSLDIKLFTDK
jgi:hypothetical protein